MILQVTTDFLEGLLEVAYEDGRTEAKKGHAKVYASFKTRQVIEHFNESERAFEQWREADAERRAREKTRKE